MTTITRYDYWLAAVRHRIYNEKRRTQKQLASEVGVGAVYLNSILREREGKKASEELQDKISLALGESYEEMLSIGKGILLDEPVQAHQTCPDQVDSNVTPAFDRQAPRDVPLISWVQAGEWQAVHDPFHPGYAEEWIDTNATRSEQAFALTVHGDSMEPEFRDGDIVVVDPDRVPAAGSFVVVKNSSDEATFKQLIFDGGSVYLKPLNDRYPIRDMTGVEFQIVGVVVEKRKRYY